MHAPFRDDGSESLGLGLGTGKSGCGVGEPLLCRLGRCLERGASVPVNCICPMQLAVRPLEPIQLRGQLKHTPLQCIPRHAAVVFWNYFGE
jgi:hypothetical protein